MEEENSDFNPFSVENQTFTYQVIFSHSTYDFYWVINFLVLGISRYFFNKHRLKHNSTKSQS